MFSADSWTLVGTYLRNLLLNWCVIIPLLAAFLALPWIFSSIVMMDPPLRTDALFWSGGATGCDWRRLHGTQLAVWP